MIQVIPTSISVNTATTLITEYAMHLPVCTLQQRQPVNSGWDTMMVHGYGSMAMKSCYDNRYGGFEIRYEKINVTLQAGENRLLNKNF